MENNTQILTTNSVITSSRTTTNTRPTRSSDNTHYKFIICNVMSPSSSSDILAIPPSSSHVGREFGV
jgi:hypothetical protein